LVNPLQTLSCDVNDIGGEIRIAWTYPDELPNKWQLYIFKKAQSAPTDDEINDYFLGDLSDGDLKGRGIYVFRNFPNSFDWFGDFQVLNDTHYFYRALIQDLETKEVSATVDLDATPRAHIVWNVVPSKSYVVRGVEKVIDAVKNREGEKLIEWKNVQVFRDHSQTQGKDFVVVVTHMAGQIAERYFDSLIAQYEDFIVRGEADMDVFQIEWISKGNTLRRDRFTDIMRAFKPILKDYILRLGNNDIKDCKLVMGADTEGDYGGVQSLRGAMTVALVIESQVQVGANIAPIGTVTQNFIGND
jgi:hypothetical protein